MSNNKQGKNHELLKQRILFVAAQDFLKNGYTNTTMRNIASQSGLSTGSVTNIFGSKEDILCDLVEFVIERQFDVTGKLLSQVTDDKILFYSAETVLQLYITELDENLREIYKFAYSYEKPSAILQQTVTQKVEFVFKEHLPTLETKDFYLREIASSGVMRGFMIEPCSMWFTMEQKVDAFLESSLRIYQVPEEKIESAKAFVRQFDFVNIAKQTLDGIFKYLEEKQKEIFNLPIIREEERR
ncbi:MAG: TetR/AcrR family transcriptional regulator [Ruminococcus sp.]|nr:TetR/AcrR family transcriptional regulator [Ruminococcus sp.]